MENFYVLFNQQRYFFKITMYNGVKDPVELEIESQLNVMLLLVVVPHVTCGVEIGGITLMFEITEAVSLHPFVFPITLMVLIGLVNTVVKNGDGLF